MSDSRLKSIFYINSKINSSEWPTLRIKLLNLNGETYTPDNYNFHGKYRHLNSKISPLKSQLENQPSLDSYSARKDQGQALQHRKNPMGKTLTYQDVATSNNYMTSTDHVIVS